VHCRLRLHVSRDLSRIYIFILIQLWAAMHCTAAGVIVTCAGEKVQGILRLPRLLLLLLLLRLLFSVDIISLTERIPHRVNHTRSMTAL